MISFITGNKKKFEEMKRLVPEVEQLDIDLPEIQSMNFREIIEAKLQEALKHHSGGCIVEDTSVNMDCLQGLPGPFIKWFLQALGPGGLAEIAQKHENDRVSVTVMIGYAEHPEKIQYFEGTAFGRVVTPRGEAGYGWDPIFMPDGFDQTYAEMGPEAKSKISARRIATDKLLAFLEEAKVA